MKKELTRMAFAVAAVALISPLLAGVKSGKDYMEAFAIGSFFISLLVLFMGIIIVIPSSARKYGLSLLLCGAVLLLLSFTLCSSGAVNLNFH